MTTDPHVNDKVTEITETGAYVSPNLVAAQEGRTVVFPIPESEQQPTPEEVRGE